MRTFIDTSAFYALLDRDDQNHQKAKRAWVEMLEEPPLMVTNNYILVETFALLQSRLGLQAVRRFQEDVIPIIQVEFITPDMHRAGTAALLSAGRRGLSLVDCVSFEVMRDMGIKVVFTFDSHFKEQGFDVIPSS
jgi:predicted nucleic acid-binding protein